MQFQKEQKMVNVLLIHGTWCNGGNWGEFKTDLEKRGYKVYAPSYRYHGEPAQKDMWGSAQKISKLGMLDYTQDFCELIDTMDSPPIIIGHSVGALIAQLVAVRRKTKGLVLLGPAPTAGMFALYPSCLKLWGRYLPEWVLGRPMYPVKWDVWQKYICNAQPLEIQESYYASLCAESGTAYSQMIFWFLDQKKSTRIDYKAVKAPVLVIGGSQDKCTPPGMCRGTAKNYGKSGKYIELEGSDHMMTVGAYKARTLAEILIWISENNLNPNP